MKPRAKGKLAKSRAAVTPIKPKIRDGSVLHQTESAGNSQAAESAQMPALSRAPDFAGRKSAGNSHLAEKPLSLAAILNCVSEYEAIPASNKSSRRDGLSTFLAEQFGLSEICRRDVYQACLMRLAEVDAILRPYKDTQEAANHALACLQCEEFLKRFPEIWTSSFPDRARVVFFHIPKTGGTDVRERFKRAPECLVWDASYEANEPIPGKTPGISDLARFARLPNARWVFTGHYVLPKFLQRGVLRAWDKAFTVVRDPIAIVISNVNYWLTKIFDEPHREDSKRWIAALGIAPPKRGATPTQMVELAHKALYSDVFRRECSNVISSYLGGPEAMLSDVCANLLVANVEVVHIDSLDTYLSDELGLPAMDTRQNISKKFIGSEFDLERNARLYIREVLCNRDLVVFDYFQRTMDRRGKSAINPAIDFV